MKCPECRAENLETRKYCRDCGANLLLICSKCGAEKFAGDKYCSECGQRLGLPMGDACQLALVDGERKHVTVLFSDLSGYTAMSEKLDPEEVKEVTSRIFGDAA